MPQLRGAPPRCCGIDSAAARKAAARSVPHSTDLTRPCIRLVHANHPHHRERKLPVFPYRFHDRAKEKGMGHHFPCPTNSTSLVITPASFCQYALAWKDFVEESPIENLDSWVNTCFI